MVSWMPARARRTAWAMASIAWRWPMTRSPTLSSMWSSFSFLRLEQLGRRDPRPARHHVRDQLLVDGLRQERPVGLRRGQAPGVLLERLLGLRELAEADRAHALEVALALGLLGLGLERLDERLAGADGGDQLLLVRPARAQRARLLVEVGQLARDLLDPAARILAAVLLERRALDLQLAQLALDAVELRRHRVDGGPQLGRGLVDAVDGLVGHEAVGDVALREPRGGDERPVHDAHPVVHLVALLEAAEDSDGVLDGGGLHEHRLEPALQGGVLLDVLAELVQRRGADHAQLAAGEHGLEHIGCVHGALGGTGADDGVHLVDEGDDAAVGCLDLVERGLETLFELAAVLRTRDHGTEIQGHESLVLETLRHVTVDDPLGETFGDGRLADAGLTDEHRVVLGAAGENLDHPPDLLVTADDRIELALRGELDQIPPVLLQRSQRVLGALRGHPLGAPNVGESRQHGLLGETELPEGCADGSRVGGDGEQDVLDRDVRVLQAAHLRLGRFEEADGVRSERHLSGVAVDLWLCAELGLDCCLQVGRVDIERGEKGIEDGVGLAEQRFDEVGRPHLLVLSARGDIASGEDRGLRFLGEGVDVHSAELSERSTRPILNLCRSTQSVSQRFHKI